jgi:hypothetical protein
MGVRCVGSGVDARDFSDRIADRTYLPNWKGEAMYVDVQTIIDRLPEPAQGVPYQVLGSLGSLSHVFWLYEMNPAVKPEMRARLFCLLDRETKRPYSEGVKIGRMYEFKRGEHGVVHEEAA